MKRHGHSILLLLAILLLGAAVCVHPVFVENAFAGRGGGGYGTPNNGGRGTGGSTGGNSTGTSGTNGGNVNSTGPYASGDGQSTGVTGNPLNRNIFLNYDDLTDSMNPLPPQTNP